MIFLAGTPAVNQGSADTISLIQLIMKGGVVMIPILILSVISVYVFTEKIFFIIKNSKTQTNLAQRITVALSKSHTDEAFAICRNNNALGRVFENGISMIGKPVKDIEAVMESAANIEVSRMEKHTGYLGIIAGIAPMLGFIGTISGVIKIFYNISLSDNISIGIIADGLYQKMITSGTGLVVGVIAYTFYHYLQIQIDGFTEKMQKEELVFIKSLQV